MVWGLNKKLMANRIQKCFESLDAEWEACFPKNIYKDLAEFVLDRAASAHKRGSDGIFTQESHGAMAVYYLCLNASLYSGLAGGVPSKKAAQMPPDDVSKLKGLVEKAKKKALEKFSASQFSTHISATGLGSAVDMFNDLSRVGSSVGMIFLNDWSRILNNNGCTCAYSEWQRFFAEEE